MSAADNVRRERIFFATMAVIATLVVFAGFAPSFFLAAANPEARHLDIIYHIHGAVFSLFMLLFIVQSVLVVRGRLETHKRLGVFTAVVGCVMIPFAFAVTIYAGKHGFGGPLSALPDPKQALAVPFFDMFVFGPLFIGALVYRKRTDIHKRLMLLAVIGGLLGAAIGRAPLFIGQLDRQLYLYLALILAGPVYDLITRKRIHPAYLIGLIPCLLLLTSMRLRIGASEPWHQFANWLVG
jgi:hypothetical protein